MVSEYTWNVMTGIYLNLVFCAWGHFLTFCIVMDQCQTHSDDEKTTTAHRINRIGRIFFHLGFLTLIAFAYFANSCEEKLYPPAFLCIGLYILLQ